MLSPSDKKIVMYDGKLGVSDWDATEKKEGKNWQDVFKCKITLRDGILYTDDWLEVTADLENLYQDAPSLPVAFALRITTPDDTEVQAYPNPTQNPMLNIALPAPFGNNKEWLRDYNWNRLFVTHTIEDGAFKTQLTPIQITKEFPKGKYLARLMTYLIWPNDETGELEAYEMSWDTKAFYVSYKPDPEPPQPPPDHYSLPQLERPIFHDHARLEAVDLNLLARLPRASTALGLSIALAGQNGVIGGLELGIGTDKRGKYVYINPGVGAVFSNVDDVSGSHPIVLTEPLRVGHFADHVPSQLRYDPIAIGLSTKDEGIEKGSNGDDRVMIYPGSSDPDTGRPIRKIKNIPTRSKYIAKSMWIIGSNDLDAAMKMIAPEGYMIVGWVKNSQNASEQSVITKEFDPVVLKQHREKSILDHPDRSVLARHIHEDVVGDFTPGKDMSLRKMSDEIKGARGKKNSINERLEAIIREDGSIVEEPIVEIIDAQLTSLFSGIVDSKGNLMPNALTGSGMLAKAAATMGVVPHGQFVQLPSGFSESQCSWIVGIAQMAFSPADDTKAARSITLICNCTGRLVNCQSVVVYSNNTERKLPGTANFLTIGWESH